jgi:hypothetical protein
MVDDAGCDLKGQPGLPAPARSGQGDQSRGRGLIEQQPTDLGELSLSPDEARRLLRQVGAGADDCGVGAGSWGFSRRRGRPARGGL